MDNKITYLDITSIGPNPRNPRKTFDDTALKELADSIKISGVLQPVTVRSVQTTGGGAQYQLVCGERRWRATAMAGLNEIPAMIRELTEEEAMDVAITENLQRKDVSPMEEADSFRYYMAERGCTIDDLCLRFGKSDPYIRGRLKLLDIIDEFRTLLLEGEISISQAMEVIKFDTDVQTQIYREHFKKGCWHSWRDMKASALYQMAMKNYTRELSRYAFDKTGCECCQNCTKNSSLFALEEEASCLDGACLRKKYLDYKVCLALSLRRKHPEADFYSRDKDGEVKTGLEAQGNDVVLTRTYIGRIGAVISKEIKAKLASGVIVLAIDVQDTPYLGYIEQELASGGDKVKDLREKDKRNKEIEEENIVSSVRDAVCNMDVETLSEGVLTDYESQLTLFILLKRLKTEQQKNLGEVEFYSMSDEEAWKVVENVTTEQVAYIHRCSILNQVGDHTRRDFKTELLFKWVDVRDAQIVPAAVQKHQEIYRKRHKKIEVQIAEIITSKEN